jgi:hypothetical protein
MAPSSAIIKGTIDGATCRGTTVDERLILFVNRSVGKPTPEFGSLGLRLRTNHDPGGVAVEAVSWGNVGSLRTSPGDEVDIVDPLRSVNGHA